MEELISGLLTVLYKTRYLVDFFLFYYFIDVNSFMKYGNKRLILSKHDSFLVYPGVRVLMSMKLVIFYIYIYMHTLLVVCFKGVGMPFYYNSGILVS